MKKVFENIIKRIEELEMHARKIKCSEILDCDSFDSCSECITTKAIEIVTDSYKGINAGNISDGYHTFNELYHHRAILFSVICNSHKAIAWKSRLHDTGDMYEGMFIVGIETPEGQATYHYDIDPYWNLFEVRELPFAPKWDGHTPEQAINRILSLQDLNRKKVDL